MKEFDRSSKIWSYDDLVPGIFLETVYLTSEYFVAPSIYEMNPMPSPNPIPYKRGFEEEWIHFPRSCFGYLFKEVD